jgi:hypothetical protein
MNGKIIQKDAAIHLGMPGNKLMKKKKEEKRP